MLERNDYSQRENWSLSISTPLTPSAWQRVVPIVDELAGCALRDGG
jgi:hypothetical protein